MRTTEEPRTAPLYLSYKGPLAAYLLLVFLLFLTMYYPNQPYINRPGWGSQSTPVEPPALPTSLSTVALQDIVEGQQRVTNGLVSLLSQERTSNDRSTRDHKQQLASLTAISQHFLTFMRDVEQKFSALEGSIRNNCPVADNSDLQNRVKDMVEVVANLGRIAEGFACSTGLRLVPVCSSIASSLPGKPPDDARSQGLAPNPWAWVPTDASPLQQDPTSFSATFPQAPRVFPAAIPNSTRSSVFAHNTGPARSVHWPSDLDPPATSWATPWSEPCYTYPYGVAGNAPAALSRFSLGGCRNFSTGTGPGTTPTAYPPPPIFPYSPPPPSDHSSSMTPVIRTHSPVPAVRVPFGPHSSPLSVPIVELPRTPASPRLTSTPSQTESVVGSIRRTHLSTITESCTPSESPVIPSPPSFGRSLPNGPSPSTSTIESFSTPSGLMVYPPVAPRAGLVTTSRVPDSQTPQTWHGIMYPSGPSSTAPSIDGFSIPSPPRVDLPLFPPGDAVRWSSLFPSAPVVVERPPQGVGSSGITITRVASQDESNTSPMSSPVRSVISYIDSPGMFCTRVQVRALLTDYFTQNPALPPSL